MTISIIDGGPGHDHLIGRLAGDVLIAPPTLPGNALDVVFDERYDWTSPAGAHGDVDHDFDSLVAGVSAVWGSKWQPWLVDGARPHGASGTRISTSSWRHENLQ
jgi:hypothetical protein